MAGVPLVVLAAAATVSGNGAGAQIGRPDPVLRYPVSGSPPKDTTLEDVAAGRHLRETVRARGTLRMLDEHYFELSDQGARALIIPVPEAHPHVLRHVGLRVEVVGYVRKLDDDQGTCTFGSAPAPTSVCDDPDLPPLPDLQDRPGWPRVSITIWTLSELDARRSRPEDADEALFLASVVSPSNAGREVHVRGRFCGTALCGAAPAPPPPGEAWLLQDGDASVWVVGKPPRGDGWRLDPSYAGDSRHWLEVVGRLEQCGGALCLRARKLSLAALPEP